MNQMISVMLFQSPSKVNSICHMNHYIESWICFDERLSFYFMGVEFIQWCMCMLHCALLLSLLIRMMYITVWFLCIEYRCQNVCWFWYAWFTYHICDFDYPILSMKMQAIFQIYLMPFNTFLHLAFRMCLVLVLICVSLQIDMLKHNCT